MKPIDKTSRVISTSCINGTQEAIWEKEVGIGRLGATCKQLAPQKMDECSVEITKRRLVIASSLQESAVSLSMEAVKEENYPQPSRNSKTARTKRLTSKR